MDLRDPRLRRLALTGSAAVAAGIVTLVAIAPPPAPVTPAASPAAGPLEATVAPSDASLPPSATSSPAPARRAPRLYALDAAELAGLPPDPVPGTRIDLWVAWEPPLTDEPQIERLVAGVAIAQVRPSVVAEGPTAIVVEVLPRDLRTLMFGDLYGRLFAVVPDRT